MSNPEQVKRILNDLVDAVTTPPEPIPCTRPHPKPFQWMISTRQQNTPNFTYKHGFLPLTMVYQSQLYVNGKLYRDFISDVINSIPRDHTVGLDIEEWTTRPELIVENLTPVIELVKIIRPDLRFGFYGVMPHIDRKAALDYHGPAIGAVRTWRQENFKLGPLAVKMDYISPSFYVYEKDIKDHIEFMSAMVEEAKRYDKPIIPYIWPRGKRDGAYANQFIQRDYWAEMLQWIYDNCDGVIIWDDLQNDWNESSAWWREVKKIREGM